MELGKINTLIIDRNTPPGLFLVDNEDNEVLLPGKYIPAEYEIGSALEVFVYLDNQERYIATTLKPFMQLYDFGWLRVNQITEHGAFLDLGIEKDLFVPFKEQARPMQEGKSYLVYMYIDEQTNRLTGTSKINKYLSNDNLIIKEFEEVDIIISHMTELGVNVIVNKKHKGLIYDNEVFKKIKVGDQLKGFVKKIREDNKIDISLQPIGYKSIETNANLILSELKKNKGYLDLTDKSDNEYIKERLQISKKSFKKAIGSLYKNEKILLKKDGIYLKE